MQTEKKKIIILGGGMSALAAAHELTDYEGWQDRYDITVYQVGWRLGGKTATGRGTCNRVEEHGIHIFQGWYYSTFRLLRDVYEERKKQKLAPESVLQDLFRDGLVANNTTLLTEFVPELGKWQNWPLILPETGDLPGDGEPLGMWALIRKGMAVMIEFLLGSPYAKKINPIAAWILYHFFPDYTSATGEKPNRKKTWLQRFLEKTFVKDGVIDRVLKKEFANLVEAFRLVKEEPTSNHHAHHSRILALVEKYIKHLERRGLPYEEHQKPHRHITLLICFAYYNIKGILADVYDPATGKYDFDKLNNLDYREWLASLGAPQWLVDCVIVKFFYTGSFANLSNETGGRVAAGTALQFLARSGGYKGSFVYQTMFGTGDVMVMPMYEVLKHRGVKFKFFHNIEQVHYSGTGAIEKISYAEQVKLSVDHYDPVTTIMEGKLNVWPSEPLYGQIDPGDARKLQAGKVNLEDPWADWTDYKKGTLSKGVDFDEVILGIPVGTLKTICCEIVDNDTRWKNMVSNIVTTPTQSAQLWFLKSLDELGFAMSEWGLPPKNGAANVVVYQNPMYSWLDNTQVLDSEAWPPGQQPKFLAYFTGPYVLHGPLPPFNDHSYQEEENKRLKNTFEQWLQDNGGWFWPNGATYTYPQGMNFQNLADITQPADGYTRYTNQFFRANVRPTDHYTLSVPGSAKFRFKTDASGYENLFLCGDWIDFGGNMGYIDGTIESGQQAGQAVRRKYGLGGHKKIWSEIPL